MADPNDVAKQFTDFYYAQFSQDRAALQGLYRDNSMLSYESTQHMGAGAIIEKLKSLPFQRVQHKITTLDAQPSSGSVASLMVLVTGQLIVDDSPNPMPYVQSFQLMPTPEGSYYVQNDIFRLVYG